MAAPDAGLIWWNKQDVPTHPRHAHPGTAPARNPAVAVTADLLHRVVRTEVNAPDLALSESSAGLVFAEWKSARWSG